MGCGESFLRVDFSELQLEEDDSVFCKANTPYLELTVPRVKNSDFLAFKKLLCQRMRASFAPLTLRACTV